MKILGKFILFIFLLIALAWAIIFTTLQTETGQQWALNQLVTFLEKQTDSQIQIRRVDFVLPLKIRLHDVVVAKNQTPLLSVQQTDFTCDWEELLQGRLMFSTIAAQHVHLGQPLWMAKNESSDLLNHKKFNWSDLRLPVPVNIQNLLIEDLTLDPALIEQLIDRPILADMLKQSTFKIEGMLSNHSDPTTVAAYLHLEAGSLNEVYSPIQLTFDLQDRQLSMLLNLTQVPFAFIDPTLSDLAGEIICSASASLQNWQEMVQAGQTETPIEGHFKLHVNSKQQDSWPGVLNGQTSLIQGKYAWSSKDAIHLMQLELNSPHLFLTGHSLVKPVSFAIEETEFEGEVHQTNSDHPLLSALFNGTIAFNGTLQGSLLAPELYVELDSPIIEVKQQRVHGLKAKCFAKLKPDNIDSFIAADLTYQHIPYQFSSALVWNKGESLALSRLRLYALETQVQGALTYSLQDHLWEGSIQADASQLAHLSPLLPLPLQGEGHLQVQLHPERNGNLRTQKIAYAWEGVNFQWKDLKASHLMAHGTAVKSWQEGNEPLFLTLVFESQDISWKDGQAKELKLTTHHRMDLAHIGDPSKWVEAIQQVSSISDLNLKFEGKQLAWKEWSAEHLHLNALVKDPLRPVASDFRFSASQVKTPKNHFAELSGESAIDLTKEAWPFTLKASGHVSENFQLVGNGLWHFNKGLLNARIDHLNGHFGTFPVQLLQPLILAHQDEKITLSSFRFLWGKAELAGDFSLDGDQLICHCEGKHISSNIFKKINPELPVNGWVSFRSHFEGTLSHPKGQMQVFLQKLQLTDAIFANKPFIEGEILLNLQEKGIGLKGTLQGIGKTPVLAEGVLPFAVSFAPFNASLQESLPFHIRLQAEGELDPFLHLFYNDSTNLTGHARIALDLHGKLQAPQVTGQVDLINGSYESLNTGAIYNNIQARLEGNGSKLILRRFRAQDQKNGIIEAEGAVTLDAAKQFPFEFHIRPTHIAILDSDYVTVSASGQLVLSGNRQRGRLQGILAADQALVRLEEALPKQVKTVDVKYVNVSEEEKQRLKVGKEPRWPLELDVVLNAPNNVRIEGNHLTSEWKGSIQARGTPESPLLFGDLRVSQGQYDFNGREFVLSQGSIHFAGPPGKKTSLYVVASKEIDRIRAEVIVKGPVDKLVVSFRSNPPLSEREVLSYILFNRGLSDITPGEGEHLTQSFMSLNTQSTQQTDFLTRLRNNIGIDRLDITRVDPLDVTSDAGENQNLSLQIGKHITKKILVSYNKSINAEADRVAIEAELRKNVKAQVEMNVSDQTQGKVMLKWKRDY